MITMPLPALSVTGMDDFILGLPVGKAQAKDIIVVASRASFGRRDETVVDTSIRCTWQLCPSQFTINNCKWEESMQLVLKNVKTGLGCDPGLTVMCELYKLLLYETGGFFKVSVQSVLTLLLFIN